jgi:tRNA threonylcarbamoyladenosine biosynthesis protein TsaB
MRILALETSSQAGSVALAENDTAIAERMLAASARSAQSLAPGISELLATIGWGVRHIDLVAVTVGPGSFTGLRVGVATAKTLAYALQARVVGLNTLEVIAAQAVCDCQRLSAVIDAQRGELFEATFERDADRAVDSGSIASAEGVAITDKAHTIALWRMTGAPRIVSTNEWLKELSSDAAVSGPALGKLHAHVPAGVRMVEQSAWSPRAATVAALAWRRHLAERYDDLWKLAPLYLRKSAAEEKWEARRGGE